MFKKVFMALALSLFLATGFNVANFSGGSDFVVSQALASVDDKSGGNKNSTIDDKSGGNNNSTITSSCGPTSAPPAGTVCVCDAACLPTASLAVSVKDHEQEKADHEQEKADHEQEKANHEKEKSDHEKEKSDHEKAKVDDEGAHAGSAKIKDDDDKIKKDDDNIKKDDDKIKEDDDKIEKDDDKLKEDDDKIKKSEDELAAMTQNLKGNGAACTCINGNNGYLFNSTGPNAAGISSLTLVPSSGGSGSSSGSSFREIGGQ